MSAPSQDDIKSLIAAGLRSGVPTEEALSHLRHAMSIATALGSTTWGRACHRASMELLRAADRPAEALSHADALLSNPELGENDSALRSRLLLESAIDGIISADSSGKILSWNRGAERLFGYTADEVIGQSLTLTMPHRFREAHDLGIARQAQGLGGSNIGKTIELWGLHKFGHEFPIELSLSVWEIPQGRFFGGVIRDISARRKSEEELQAAKEAAEQANEAKSRFIATMSHELRTPLNAILGYSQIMQRTGDLTPLQERGIRTIEQSGEHLLNLINDILDLAKIESGRFTLHETTFSVRGVINAACEVAEVQARQKGLGFSLRWVDPASPTTDVLLGDERRLGQVLLNLTSNAIKFTQQGEVQVTASLLDGTVRIEVKDTGIGIPALRLGHIFEPYQQEGNALQRTQGTGLGLSITRQLVELMEGSIQVTSEDGVGSAFTLEIPFAIASEPLKREVPSPPASHVATDHELLIVDDNAANRAVLADLLGPLGFRITEAEDGEAGLRAAEERTPALMIIDLIMPKMDGFELIRRVRGSKRLHDLPLIATSSSVFEEEYERSTQSGCDVFVPKPIKPDLLLQHIHRLLGMEPAPVAADREPRHSPDAHATDALTPDAHAPFEIPPKVDTAALVEHIKCGDVQGILDSASALANRDGRWAPFAEQIHTLANEFQIKKIWSLLSEPDSEDRK